MDLTSKTDTLQIDKSISESLLNWDKASSVRTKQNTYDLSRPETYLNEEKFWFIPNALPCIHDPEFKLLGENAANTLLARYLVFFLDYTSALETEIVNRSIKTISTDSLKLNLNCDIKLTALRLYADEAYHAVISTDVANQVSSIHGIQSRAAANDKIRKAITPTKDVSENHKELAWFLIGFVSETVITKEYLEFTKKTIYQPVFQMMRDHLEDEFKHVSFFSRMFSLVWSKADEADRKFIRNFTPKIIKEFFKPHDTWLHKNLIDLGVSTTTASRISDDLNSERTHIARVKAGCTTTILAMRKAGFFNDPRNSLHFIKEEVIDG
ncbi:hypothetical protein Pres01_46720 [Metapseudomonas resinovorans]|uniref:diiron oxygenase n=1 Tax=Metapseudomonas resinovorans TaxID=53412 RepID=UPI000984C267|nr:diiron oxygenase [Pseudomonas resinovorans]GLZ88621.1 hypothetical protein Pres01_46720 [Pseudomonas resinovorans]